jgi:CheY-like chemotaxis protein
LYIEDNPNDARLVQRYIETTTHDLTIVQTFEAASELVPSSHTFDLILVDILIDNKRTGYELAQTLRKEGYTRPIVAVTALTSKQDQAACAQAGFAAILTKPFTITSLADMLLQLS